MVFLALPDDLDDNVFIAVLTQYRRLGARRFWERVHEALTGAEGDIMPTIGNDEDKTDEHENGNPEQAIFSLMDAF